MQTYTVEEVSYSWGRDVPMVRSHGKVTSERADNIDNLRRNLIQRPGVHFYFIYKEGKYLGALSSAGPKGLNHWRGENNKHWYVSNNTGRLTK